VITARFTFPDLASALRHAERRISEEMIVAMQTNRGLLFDNQGAYNGHPAWDPLMLRSGQILANRGVLKKSIAPGTGSGQPGPGGIATMADGVVTIGTAVASAALMNYGTTQMPDGVMRPVKAKALMIPIPGGAKATEAAKTLRRGRDENGERTEKAKKIKTKDGRTQHVIFRKWVRIPARPFNTITSADRAEFAAALQAVMDEVMREAANG
jgi:phage gpG-like protein